MDEGIGPHDGRCEIELNQGVQQFDAGERCDGFGHVLGPTRLDYDGQDVVTRGRTEPGWGDTPGE